MPALFPNGSQRRIADALNLERSQLEKNCMLRILMTNLELFDKRQDTTLVGDVLAALDDLEDVADEAATVVGNDGIKRLDIDRELVIENFGPGAASSAVAAKRNQLIGTVRRLLDQYDQLERYNLTGRSIMTL